ncbi:phage portal protein [Sphingobium lignivorans]|uniref:Lambda family phage portal protein n=1 Tax=Sphingobium lignivorans TaxID=2735886 RepID=A0ABR6NF57_9SPHN|nr:phage portal protein [Sphingobium lignivorans]MBB5985924.1 lambda family phage portal protein [Sphingobium lignivorans]
MGAFDGADRLNSSIANFIPTLGSADADIIPSKELADGRAQHLLNNDAYVQGGQTLHKDNIVGSQFLLNARPMSRTIFGKVDDPWENEFQEEVEEIFDLASESPDHFFDAQGMNTLTGLVRLAVGIACASGEALASVEWIKDGRPFNTAIQMIDVARLSTPDSLPEALDPNIRGGVKKDRRGKPQSYYIRNVHPHDLNYHFTRAMEFNKWREVPARTKWGRAQMIHIMEQSRPDQTRGIADLTAALKEIHITHKFRDITLQNAVTQALYAAAITSELPSETVFSQLGGGTMTPEQIEKAIQSYAIGFYNTIDQFAGSAKNLHVDGVRIPHLLPGTKLEMISPGKGGPLGENFEQSLLRYIAATLGVSYEQLSRDYTNTSYASARAAMADTWRFMQARKKSVADKFATIIFRLWLEEMINANALSTFPASKAPMLYTNGRLNMKFEAISRCEWIGASRGQIDELKETQAAVLRINNNLSTREDEIARLGGDWRKKMRQLKREQDLFDSLGLRDASGASANMMNAANGTADTADEKGKTK